MSNFLTIPVSDVDACEKTEMRREELYIKDDLIYIRTYNNPDKDHGYYNLYISFDDTGVSRFFDSLDNLNSAFDNFKNQLDLSNFIEVKVTETNKKGDDASFLALVNCSNCSALAFSEPESTDKEKIWIVKWIACEDDHNRLAFQVEQEAVDFFNAFKEKLGISN